MYETREERDALFSFTGKYTEMKLLNQEATGFGWAVLVQDNFENKRLKVVKLPNREAATRELLVEAEILSKIAQYLRHPNLVALGSVDRYVVEWNGQKEERWFIVLQYGGDNLRKRMGRLGLRTRDGHDEYVYRDGVAMPVEEVLRIGIQVADGLRALHDFEEGPGQHIVHRDIKPENILIDSEGVVRVTDFGISKVVERLSQSVSVAGTLPYLAPEYSRGWITAASDIYALGIVLYEMATGRFPFTRPEDRFYQMPEPAHAANPQVPALLSDVIQRALWWDPHAGRGEEAAQRYQRSADLVRDLQRCRSRLFPVPSRFVRRDTTGQAPYLYHDAEARTDVRIFLYEAAAPGPCKLRLGPVSQLQDRRIPTPQQLIEPEGMIGVVVPCVPGLGGPSPVSSARSTEHFIERPPGQAQAPTPPVRVEGQAIYELLPRVVVLVRQLDRLHRLGIYHGLLTPHCVRWDGEGWVIDHLWLGALAGHTAAAEVFEKTGVTTGYVAPEVLRWEGPPALAGDIYGVGALLYGWLTGAAPLSDAEAQAVTRGQPAPPSRAGAALRELAPTASRRLQAIVVKALQTDPGQRQRSLDELDRELGACRWPDDMVFTLIEDAREYRRQGKVMEAYDALDRAQRLEPGSPGVHHARAEVYYLEGEFKWALKENQKALDVDDSAPICYLHAQCLARLGRCEEAADLARMGLEKGDCSRGRHLLAQCLEKLGLPQKALTEYRQAQHMAELIEHDLGRVQEIRTDLSNLLQRLGQ